MQGGQVLLLQAPAGFGKTSLLAQWRREWLRHGVLVAWLTLDERDEEMRLIAAMRFAVRAASLKSSTRTSDTSSDSNAKAAATQWLAEVAAMAAPLSLILDDAHTLPDSRARHLLEYVVCNAPANLTLALASRTIIELPVAKRVGSVSWVALDAEALRMTPKESTAALIARFGRGVDKNMAARLHETSAGWALGLQLMSSTIEQGTTSTHALELAERAKQGGEQYFTEFLLNRLEPTAVGLLLRISLVDAINPELVVALTGRPESACELKQLCKSTPVLHATVGSNWMKLHPLAREVLRAQALQVLSDTELQGIHERALEWLAGHGLNEQAAHHALASGQTDRAYELAERCLYSLALDGHFGRARAQLDRIPFSVLLSRPKLALAAAFVKAFGEPDAQADVLIAAVRAHADLPVEIQRETVAVEIVLAYIQENLDRAAELIAESETAHPAGSTDLDQRMLSQSSAVLLFTGHPHLARHRCTEGVRAHAAGESNPGHIICTFIVGRSYLWEGQATLAAAVLGPASDDVQRKLGRRNWYSLLLDTTLAAAMWELDQPEAAATLLADRLDAVAAEGLPHVISKGFITASRIAAWEGHEAKRLDLLDYLCTLAETRRAPWMMLEALTELIAVHSRAGRVHSSARLLQRAMASHAAAAQRNPKTLAPLLDLRLDICKIYACLASKEFREAQRHLERAVSRASELRRGQDYIECRLLQAVVMHRLGGNAQELLRESINLAGVLGLKRILVDTHPGLAGLVSDLRHLAAPGAIPAAQRAPEPAARRKEILIPTDLLTPKEREVLGLLAQGLQNKEIAVACAVGQETVKWHIKNLFAKLGVANRRHAIARARMLGMLALED
jgi:LuxR family maltose regulon positive regulatory protein